MQTGKKLLGVSTTLINADLNIYSKGPEGSIHICILNDMFLT